MKRFRQKRASPTLISIAVAILLWMPSNRANAQDEAAAAAAKSKITFPTKVVDSKGKTIGTYQPINQVWGPYGILDTAIVLVNGSALQLAVGANGFPNTCENSVHFNFFFKGAGCSGDVVVQVQNGQEGSVPLALDTVTGTSGCVEDNVAYYPQAPYSSIPIASYGSGPDPEHVSCNSGGGTV